MSLKANVNEMNISDESTLCEHEILTMFSGLYLILEMTSIQKATTDVETSLFQSLHNF
jgi:hypothetical protein